MPKYLICEIYDRRPKACRDYPQSGSWQPEGCSYYFEHGERKGTCSPECQASCCAQPRVGGEPGGAAMPEISGGLPCKHLMSSDTRSLSSDGEKNPERERD